VAAAASCKPDSAAFKLRKTAKSIGVPMVATPDSFFTVPDDFHIHRMLRAIDLNTITDRLSKTDTAHPHAWPASPAVYKKRFDLWPDTINATYEISERLTFTGPEFGLVMPPWEGKNGCTATQQLRHETYIGARSRYGDDLPETVVDRLEHELKTIEEMGFSSYFLVVRDIVLRSPRICGRGSGAASLVASCLEITNVCPVKHTLYFV
ncbi:MAG: DNA polymerase III subunit alpha, partial [bacterium]|nr:DNA polymerase III subunit alpha [bacterium]